MARLTGVKKATMSMPPKQARTAVPGAGVFATWAPLYWGASYTVVPVTPGTRASAVSPDGRINNVPSEAQRQSFVRQHPEHGIGLLFGQKCKDETRTAGLDVDDDRLVAFVKAVVGPAPAKFGSKGETFFVRVPENVRGFQIRNEALDKKQVVDFLGTGQMSVLPPTKHWKTGKPYLWTSKQTLLDVKADELPLLEHWQLALMKHVLTWKRLPEILSGEGTHVPMRDLVWYSLGWFGANGDEPDTELARRALAALLPDGYDGDTMEELSKDRGNSLINGAFRKGSYPRPTHTSFPDLTKSGRPRPTLPNTKVALNLLDIECRYDLFKLRYLINGHQLESSFSAEVSDPALLWMREKIYERFQFDPTTTTVHTAIQTRANHARFHPVCDYLDGLKWDGVHRIDTWLIDYAGSEDTEFVRAVGALLLVAAVRRVRSPGCKFDELLVLESGQGTNKSQALRTLAVQREWFSDNLPLDLQARETIEALSGRWIVEVSELQGMRKSEIEKVKAFLSRDTDRARTAYAVTATEAPRQCVVVGTTNSEQYLRDLTGNRRFWPVQVERFDLGKLERDRDQLWAEAAAREVAGASIRLPENLWAAAEAEQLRRMTDNPFLSTLDRVLREEDVLVGKGKWADGKLMEGKIAAEDLWTALNIRPSQRSQMHNENLGDAMKQLGWTRTRLRIGEGERVYGYVKGKDPHRRIIVYPASDGSPARAVYEDEEEARPSY
jgi:hypothetical protein